RPERSGSYPPPADPEGYPNSLDREAFSHSLDPLRTFIVGLASSMDRSARLAEELEGMER
ncbi:hypothetical protein ACQKKG_07535, partial [Brevundimonas sp. NPDC003935]|uniref:hypothetical protein n=1 Tax=unclassified Brevundimonas TaxID=2622653 RepID=UPI0038516829